MTKAHGVGVGILGMGAYLPARVRTNAWWPEAFSHQHQTRLEADLATGIDQAAKARAAGIDPEVIETSLFFEPDPFRGSRERRVIDDDREPSDLSVEAGRLALAHANVTSSDVDLLLDFSQLPDHVVPEPCGHVAFGLGLRPNLRAFTLSAGCGSYVPQIATATALIRCGEAKTALTIVGSAMSRTLDFTTPNSVLVGDGAVATVLGSVEAGFGYVASEQITRGDLHGGIVLAPEDDPHGRWYEGHSRLVGHNLDRAATMVMGGQSSSLCRELCMRLLDRVGVTIDEVDVFVCSQPNAWYGAAAARGLGIPDHKRVEIEAHFCKYGHLMAASAALNLYIAASRGQLEKGDLVLIFSPGAGFVLTACLYRWHHERPFPPIPDGR
jgi:3-oxoacyl-[acyl-carrier-protein] synthase III